MRVSINIDGAIMMSQVLGHDGSPVGRVFAVQDKRSTGLGSTEEFTGETFLVVIVQCTGDVTTLILILEAAVDDENVVELVIELAVHEFQKSALVDARQRVRAILRDEVRQLHAGRARNVTDGLDGCICRYLGLFIGNNICWVLKHTQ